MHSQAFQAVYTHAMDPFLTLAQVDDDLAALDEAYEFFAAQKGSQAAGVTYDFFDGDGEKSMDMDVLSQCERLRRWVRRQRLILARRAGCDSHLLTEDVRVLASMAEWLDDFARDDRHFALWVAKDWELRDQEGDNGDGAEEEVESIGAIVRACRRAWAAVCVGAEIERRKMEARSMEMDAVERKRSKTRWRWWCIGLSLLGLVGVLGTGIIIMPVRLSQMGQHSSPEVRPGVNSQIVDSILSPATFSDPTNDNRNTSSASTSNLDDATSWLAYLSTSPRPCAHLSSSPVTYLTPRLHELLANPPPLPPQFSPSHNNTGFAAKDIRAIDLHVRTCRHVSRVARLAPTDSPDADFGRVLKELRVLREMQARVAGWRRLRVVEGEQEEGARHDKSEPKEDAEDEEAPAALMPPGSNWRPEREQQNVEVEVDEEKGEDSTPCIAKEEDSRACIVEEEDAEDHEGLQEHHSRAYRQHETAQHQDQRQEQDQGADHVQHNNEGEREVKSLSWQTPEEKAGGAGDVYAQPSGSWASLQAGPFMILLLSLVLVIGMAYYSYSSRALRSAARRTSTTAMSYLDLTRNNHLYAAAPYLPLSVLVALTRWIERGQVLLRIGALNGGRDGGIDVQGVAAVGEDLLKVDAGLRKLIGCAAPRNDGKEAEIAAAKAWLGSSRVIGNGDAATSWLTSDDMDADDGTIPLQGLLRSFPPTTSPNFADTALLQAYIYAIQVEECQEKFADALVKHGLTSRAGTTRYKRKGKSEGDRLERLIGQDMDVFMWQAVRGIGDAV
ncbi:hypothetical protein Tdes44962_MAKER07935 [Teratosphaeria destructans]|uniref:Uncharacterized protein n=1 Tax=Teratosphaeria destructans TaxID=418781 RepID=A0A9W7SXV5_9PEZI|nr:hypothetical protein Tdes44962_MAKER07935 [Teratosphaeria destructans]